MQRGLEREAAAVHRRGERQDRPLELLSDVAVLRERRAHVRRGQRDRPPGQPPGEPQREQREHGDRADRPLEPLELGVAVVVGDRRRPASRTARRRSPPARRRRPGTTGMPFSATCDDLVARRPAGSPGSARRARRSRSSARRSGPTPISAVPSEAPRFCAVPCRPPASLVLAGSTDDMITLPSCDSSSPAPTPNSASATANCRLVQLDVDRRRAGARDATTSASEPGLRDALGREAGGEPRPGMRRDEHRHRHREQPLAGLEGVEAEHHLEVDGQHEERAEQDQLLHHQRRQARAQRRGSAAASGRAACRGPARSRRSSQMRERGEAADARRGSGTARPRSRTA